MKTSFKKRVLSVLLTLAMLIPMIPMIPKLAVPASAAGTLTVTDANIGLSWSDASNSKGAADWTASGTTVTGKATGYKGGFMGLQSYAVTTTLTITNNYSDDRTLSFEYSLAGGGSVSGIISGTSGSYSDTLEAGTSATITLTSPKGTSTNTLEISKLALLSAGNMISTFLEPENGSYTVDGTSVTAQTQLTKPSTEAYVLHATPAANYMFFGWWSEASKSYVSYEATASLKFGFDPQLKPVFLHNTTALFGVGTKTFADLTEAANFANSSAATTKTVVLLNNGTVTGNHTIPAGVTLLVPYDDSNTQYGSSASCTSYTSLINNSGNIKWVQPTAYRTLTLATNAKITVNGNIEVSGQHAASNGSERYCGSPTGPLGWVKMLSGSNITLNSGSNLYSWGYIQGDGTITAKSGSKVYENFQFTDFRGGTNTSSLASEGLAFPINQYYVQNIEVATTYEYGAEEHIATSIFMSNQKFSATVKFMGDGGMFIPASGATITKDYIENRDRLQIDVNGNGTLNSMSLSLGGTNINSAMFVLPMTNNITINIHSGTTTANQSVSLLPGTEMTIDQGATLVIAKGNGGINDYTTESFGLIVYDYDEWTYGINLADGSVVVGKYAFGKGSADYSGQMSPLVYAPGRTYNRTVATDLSDAKLNVNGTIICDGYLYTTAGGGNIISSGKTGEIILNSGAGNDMMDFQANEATALVIPMQAAQLKNGDGSYTSTYIYHYDDEGILIVDYQAPAGTTYEYCATHDCWYTGECDKCKTQVNVKWMNGSEEIYNEDIDSGSVPSFKSDDPTKEADAAGHYIFAGWSTNANATTPDTLGAVTADTIYYAVFTSEAHDKDEIIDGKHYCSKCDYNTNFGSCSDTDGDHKCDVGDEDYACTEYSLTKKDGQAATCGVDGWKEYYECSCGKYYEDSEAITEITDLDSWKTGAGKIPALNHEWNDPTYTWSEDGKSCTATRTCGNDAAHKETATATVTGDVTTPATCTENGWTTYTANFDVEWADVQTTTRQDVPAKDHAWSVSYEWSADGKNCTATRICGNDAAHKETETATATGDVTTPATCTEMGTTTYTANFNAEWADGQTTTRQDVPVKEHSFNTKASGTQATPADCENAATYYVQCDNCDAVSDTKTVAVGSAKDHAWTVSGYTNNGETHTINYVCENDNSHNDSKDEQPHTFVRVEGTNKYACVCGAEEVINLPDVSITDIKNTLTAEDPDLTFALNFSIKDLANLDEEYIEKLLEVYGSFYTDYILTISGLSDESVTFNEDGSADGYLAGSYGEYGWIPVPFEDVTVMNGESLYIMEYAAKLMGSSGLRYTLAEVATIVQNFDCGVYFTPEFLAANPNLKVTLELKVFTEDADGNKINDISVATNEFDSSNIAAIVFGEGKQTEYYASLIAANNGAEAGDTIFMLKDATLTGKLIVDEKVTIDGNGHSIIADANTTWYKNVTTGIFTRKDYYPWILIQGDGATIKNVTIASNGNAGGIKIEAENVVFDNVSIIGTKADAITIDGSIILKNYLKVADTTYSIIDARNGVVTAEPGTVFDITKFTGSVSPVTSDLKGVVDTEGNLYFCAYNSTTYIVSLTSTTSLNGLTLLKDATLPASKTLSGITSINLNGHIFSVADGKVITVNGKLVFNGEGDVEGEMILGAPTATIEGPADMDVTSGVEYFTAVYKNGVYKLQLNNGWVQLEGDWYYIIDTENEVFAQGITRVPYPTVAINGNTYEPEGTSDTFIDSKNAWFIFDDEGVFQYETNGFIDHNGTTRYAVNGMIPWHYGFATDGTDYYYFIGDTENGGNKTDTGDVYMIRPNGLTINGKPVYEKGVYTFGADGKLCFYEGITNVENELRYYYNYCYTAKNGLIKVDADKYIYVRSSTAKLVVNGQYRIGENAYDIVPGTYFFDADGYLTDVKYINKNGVYYEDDAYYYYVGGKRYYAGLIKYTGVASDGTVYDDAYIYVRNNGQLATGNYWITKSNGNMEATTYLFNEFGIMDMRDGIVEENGSLYYYVNGVLAVGKGLIKIDDNYYYVRSNGEVVNNCSYWITNTNDYNVIAKVYAFDENGVMLDVESKDESINGVVDGYYYVDGQISYGAGPVVWEGNIYYVRSNGMVATGEYWTTAENEILSSGIYYFDESGKLISK